MKKLLPFAAVAAISFACGTPARKCTSFVDCDPGQTCIQGECRGGNAGGGAGGSGGTGGTGGFSGGTGGSGGGAGGGSTGGGTGTDAGLIEPDAGIDPTYDGGCGPPVPGTPTIRRLCAAASQNECDGPTDSALAGGGVPSGRLNGATGNGFDDDCDGLVDEGCGCPSGGSTKDCYLVPATQVDAASGLPVGWCSANAKGSLDCSGGELATWSGVCRGAQPPAISDTCSPGDFNCDGLQANNATRGCNCADAVTCPTAAITLAPYPSTTAIPRIDGSAWITDAAQRANATNWTWTVLGGDCDNVLPFPTFALYNQQDSTVGTARQGARTPVRLNNAVAPVKYEPQAGAPLIAIRAANYGQGVAGGQLYPAFGLSGDYIVQGEFTLNGQQYVCTQKVQVRAPGIRAELCWDSVGSADIDLHFARLQGITCPNNAGWTDICTSGGRIQDCYYDSTSGCRSTSAFNPGWGYANSADAACLGWSSKRLATGTQRCTNPRLDRDNISCTRTEANPTATSFCGPENINLDNPVNGDTFVVGVNHYSGATSKPHLNLYCNGERVLSAGYNPATGVTGFPLLNTPGDDFTGDFWTVATIRANVAGGQLTNCTVNTVTSRTPDPVRDGTAATGGGTSVCVDHNYASKRFVDTGTGQGLAAGAQPTTAPQFCKH